MPFSADVAKLVNICGKEQQYEFKLSPLSLSSLLTHLRRCRMDIIVWEMHRPGNSLDKSAHIVEVPVLITRIFSQKRSTAQMQHAT
jgi:hypothetical protein